MSKPLIHPRKPIQHWPSSCVAAVRALLIERPEITATEAVHHFDGAYPEQTIRTSLSRERKHLYVLMPRKQIIPPLPSWAQLDCVTPLPSNSLPTINPIFERIATALERIAVTLEEILIESKLK